MSETEYEWDETSYSEYYHRKIKERNEIANNVNFKDILQLGECITEQLRIQLTEKFKIIEQLHINFIFDKQLSYQWYDCQKYGIDPKTTYFQHNFPQYQYLTYVIRYDTTDTLSHYFVVKLYTCDKELYEMTHSWIDEPLSFYICIATKNFLKRVGFTSILYNDECRIDVGMKRMFEHHSHKLKHLTNYMQLTVEPNLS